MRNNDLLENLVAIVWAAKTLYDAPKHLLADGSVSITLANMKEAEVLKRNLERMNIHSIMDRVKDLKTLVEIQALEFERDIIDSKIKELKNE